MTRLTLRAVNEELERLGQAERLTRGAGHYYFAKGEAHRWPRTFVTTKRLNEMTLEQWITTHRQLQDDYLRQEDAFWSEV